MDEDHLHPGLDAPTADATRRARLHAALARLLGDVDPVLRDEVEAVVHWIRLPAGDELFRMGDPADAAYVVVAGRLRVVVPDGAEERTLTDVGRGRIVGELALLTGARRSATVFAIRGSLLARIATTDFEALLRRRPEAGLPLTRLISDRLRAVTASTEAGPVGSVVVGVLSLGGVDAAATARALAAALGPDALDGLVDASVGASIDAEHLDVRLDEHEDGHPRTIYVGDADWTSWNARLLDRADELLLLARADGDPAPGALDRHVFAPGRRAGPRVTLVVAHEPDRQPSGTSAWLEARPGARHLHVRRDDPSEMSRLARWVTGCSVALVLGGGGARGWAHLGAARAIRDLGIPVDLVGGTSMGALVGAAIADGMSPEEMLRRGDGVVDNLLDFTAPLLSLVRGRRIQRALEQVARPGSTVEDLWRPFFAVTTNLTRAEPVVIDRGPLGDAIRASIALPGILPPVIRDGDLIVDGGVLDNLPVATMRSRMGHGRIIAVDVSPGVDLDRFDAFEPDVSGWRLLWERVRHRGARRRVPTIVDVLLRTVVAASVHLRRRDRAGRPEDLVLEPDLGEWALLDFGAKDAIAEAGYQAMRQPLAAWWADPEDGPG